MQMSNEPYLISGSESSIRWPIQTDPEPPVPKTLLKHVYRIICRSGKVYIQQVTAQYQCQFAAASIICDGNDFDVWIRHHDLLGMLDTLARDPKRPIQMGKAVSGQRTPGPLHLALDTDGRLKLQVDTMLLWLPCTRVAPSDFRDLFNEACVDMPDRAITSKLALDAIRWLATQLSQWKDAKSDVKACIRDHSITVATERAGSLLTGTTHLPQMDLSLQQVMTLLQWLTRIAVKYIYVHLIQPYGSGYEMMTMTSLDGADRLTMVVGAAGNLRDQRILTPRPTPWLTQVEVRQLADVVWRFSVLRDDPADLVAVVTLGNGDAARPGAAFSCCPSGGLHINDVLSCVPVGMSRDLQVHPRLMCRVLRAFDRNQTITIRTSSDEAMIVMDDQDEPTQTPYHRSAWLRCTNRGARVP